MSGAKVNEYVQCHLRVSFQNTTQKCHPKCHLICRLWILRKSVTSECHLRISSLEFFSSFLTWKTIFWGKKKESSNYLWFLILDLILQVPKTPRWGLVSDTGHGRGHGYVGIEKGQNHKRCKRFTTKIDLLDTRTTRKGHFNIICYVWYLFESGSAIWHPFRGGVIGLYF